MTLKLILQEKKNSRFVRIKKPLITIAWYMSIMNRAPYRDEFLKTPAVENK